MEAAVVSTWHSGIPEGVKDGITAELVDERDVAGLADKLGSFLESPQRAAEFGREGRLFVESNFDIKSQARGLEDIYSHAAELMPSRA
jgi:colanic acid/amylovoran biosynthesis glycosyltransferase